MKRIWKIYYGDGSTYSNEDGPPEKAPKVNAQVIILEDKSHGWSNVSGEDYYVWEDRGKGFMWWGCDRTGLDYFLFHSPGKKIALMGRFIEDDHFDEIMKRAHQDDYFPGKSGYRANERMPKG